MHICCIGSLSVGNNRLYATNRQSICRFHIRHTYRIRRCLLAGPSRIVCELLTGGRYGQALVDPGRILAVRAEPPATSQQILPTLPSNPVPRSRRIQEGTRASCEILKSNRWNNTCTICYTGNKFYASCINSFICKVVPSVIVRVRLKFKSETEQSTTMGTLHTFITK